jgi:hypothetical protein
MRIRTYLSIACCALLTMIAIGATASVSVAEESAVPAFSAAIESPADLAAPADQCLPEGDALETFNEANAYECPKGVPYCYQSSQCEGFCGPGGFDLCYRGCCTCAG